MRPTFPQFGYQQKCFLDNDKDWLNDSCTCMYVSIYVHCSLPTSKQSKPTTGPTCNEMHNAAVDAPAQGPRLKTKSLDSTNPLFAVEANTKYDPLTMPFFATVGGTSVEPSTKKGPTMFRSKKRRIRGKRKHNTIYTMLYTEWLLYSNYRIMYIRYTDVVCVFPGVKSTN